MKLTVKLIDSCSNQYFLTKDNGRVNLSCNGIANSLSNAIGTRDGACEMLRLEAEQAETVEQLAAIARKYVYSHWRIEPVVIPGQKNDEMERALDIIVALLDPQAAADDALTFLKKHGRVVQLHPAGRALQL